MLRLTSNFARWWFYQHGRFCAQHPRIAAVIGIVAVLASILGLFNPRGQPFVFAFESIWREFTSWVHSYAIPRWHVGAYLALVIYIAVAADKGVKYSTLRKINSLMGLSELGPDSPFKFKKAPRPAWTPPLWARLTVGLCGVLTILSSIVISVAFSHSVLGVELGTVFDELPFLIVYLGVQGVFSLLDASTETFCRRPSADQWKGKQVYVVDRVNQIAMATSITGPEDLLKTLAKASIALLALFPVFEFLFGPTIGPTVSHFCVHAGLGVLAKYLLQMSVFASIVQALVPFWDPNHKARAALMTPEAKCRVCLESSADIRRCPCKCTGSVGYIHPVCFQQWFERKKSLRCELCHVVFNVKMLPTSILTNPHTFDSFLGEVLPPLVSRMIVYALCVCALLCNKLGLIVFDSLEGYIGMATSLKHTYLFAATVTIIGVPLVFTACAQVIPKVYTDWHRRHRVMHWDAFEPDASDDDSDGEGPPVKGLGGGMMGSVRRWSMRQVGQRGSLEAGSSGEESGATTTRGSWWLRSRQRDPGQAEDTKDMYVGEIYGGHRQFDDILS